MLKHLLRSSAAELVDTLSVEWHTQKRGAGVSGGPGSLREADHRGTHEARRPAHRVGRCEARPLGLGQLCTTSAVPSLSAPSGMTFGAL